MDMFQFEQIKERETLHTIEIDSSVRQKNSMQAIERMIG